jgi:CRISPR-associated protein Csx16
VIAVTGITYYRGKYMTTYFVSRHRGAIQWAYEHGLENAVLIMHMKKEDIDNIHEGDIVVGVLPVNLAAEVCAIGARYFNLETDIPLEARGKELTLEEMNRYGARINEYTVKKTETYSLPSA